MRLERTPSLSSYVKLTLRELRNHAELGLRPVCFVDDDTRRHGAEIHGVPIVAGFDGLAWVVHRHKIDKIVIGTRHLAPQAVALIQALAGKLGLEVAEVHFEVRWIAAPKLAIEPVVVAERSVGTAAGGNGDVGSLVAAAAGVGGGSNGNGNGHGAVADLRVAG